MLENVEGIDCVVVAPVEEPTASLDEPSVDTKHAESPSPCGEVLEDIEQGEAQPYDRQDPVIDELLHIQRYLGVLNGHVQLLGQHVDQLINCVDKMSEKIQHQDVAIGELRDRDAETRTVLNTYLRGR